MTRLALSVATLCVVFLGGAAAEDTGAEFLQTVMNRIGGKPDAPAGQDLARPVADLKAALERVSATMAAAGMEVLPASAAAASQHVETVMLTGDGLEGPPFVLAPTPEAPLTSGSGPPPSLQAPPLSKDELAAVYQAVANKGVQLDLASVKGGYIPSSPGAGPSGAGPPGAASDDPGYYYYFFPIKDLGDGKTPQLQMQQLQMQQLQQFQQLGAGAGPNGVGGDPPGSEGDREAALGMMAQLTGDPGAMMAGADGQKSVEPLFMAMSGFIGMALMFIMSVLFLPKWGALRSRGVTALKHAPDELASLTKLVVQSIEGKDCSERIACEVGRAVRSMHLGNKPLRVLEVVLPPHLSKQIGHIRRAVRKAEKCSFIPCKYPAGTWWEGGTAKPPYGKPPFHKPLFDKPPFDKPLFDKPLFDKPPFDKPLFDKPAFIKPLFDKPPFNNKLPPKRRPTTTTPRPAAARSTPRSKPLPHRPPAKAPNNKNANNKPKPKPKPARPARPLQQDHEERQPGGPQ